MRTKKKFILSWSFATPAARTIRPTSDPIQPVLRRGRGFARRLRASSRCSPRFNASASSRHAPASLSSISRCLGFSVFAAARRHSCAGSSQMSARVGTVAQNRNLQSLFDPRVTNGDKKRGTIHEIADRQAFDFASGPQFKRESLRMSSGMR